MRGNCPRGIEKMTSVRASNVDPNTSIDRIEKLFSKYGKIGDIFRPTDLDRKIPREFIFIRYINSNDADNAIAELNGFMIDDREIVVKKAVQDSFFTQDTGFITNEALDHPKIETHYFDSTMPATHYIEKRKKEIEEVDVTFGIRVDDIHPDITIEQIKSIFENFGEISSLYYPINLKERIPRGFCIIRYLNMDDAKSALETMNNTNIGRGRNILVSYVQSKSYWSLDETTDEALKEQRKKL